MKHFELLSAAVLLMLLGTVVPTLAQERHEEQAKPEKQEQAKPEKQAKPAQQKQQEQQPQAQQKQQKAQQQQAKGQQKQQKAQQQQAKGQQNQQKAQQQQAKGQQKQQKAQQQQAKDQQKQQKAQQPQAMGQQEGASQRPQRTPQAESKQRGEPPLRLSARGQGRIPDDRFRSNFGRGHEFSIGSPSMVDGYSRFQYGGFWFGFVQPWPDDWYYTDDVYIDYVDGGYFLFDPYYPGVRIAVSVVM
jgi:hypothetical protein